MCYICMHASAEAVLVPILLMMSTFNSFHPCTNLPKIAHVSLAQHCFQRALHLTGFVFVTT